MINIADFLLLLVAIFWGITFKLVQNAISDIPVFMFLFLRFFLSFLFMFLIFYKKINFNKKDIIAALILGMFNFFAFSTQTYALLYTTSSIVAFITGLYVIFTPIVAYFILKKRISKYTLIGTILSFIGLYLLTGANLSNFGLGEILTLICAMFIALHINFTDIYSKKYNLYTLVTFQFLTVSIFSLILSPFEKGNIIINYNVIIALIVTVMFATIFAYFIQTYAQKFTTPTKTAIIFTMEPVSAALFSYFYGEELNLIQIIGAILVILSMIITECKKISFKKFFNFQ